MTFGKKPYPQPLASDENEYSQKVSDADFEKKAPRKALPGRSKADKHPVIKRGEPLTSPHLIGKWSPR